MEKSIAYCRFKFPGKSSAREVPSCQQESVSSSIVKIFIPILNLRVQVHFLPLVSLQNIAGIPFIIAYSDKS